MYRIVYSRMAARAIERMPRNTADRIESKIVALAADPYAPNMNAKRLVGRPGYRLRLGDWRIVYEIDDEIRILAIQRIDPRGSACQ